MQVETYEVSEVRKECIDDKNELIRLSEELGLVGQAKLLDDSTTSTFPYRKMTTIEERVYSILLPAQTKLSHYEEAVIPVRVLQVAAHAQQFDETRHLKVWYCPSSPDPILVGQKGEYSGPQYILARWGEVLDSFEVIKKQAVAKLIVKAKAEIKTAVTKITAYENGIEERCAAYLDGFESKYAPTVYD